MKDTCLDASVKQLLRNYNLSVQSGNDKLFLCSFIFTSLTFYLAGSKQVEAKTVGAKKTCFGEQLPTHQFLTKWLLKVTEEFDWDHGTFPYRALVRHRTCCKTSSFHHCHPNLLLGCRWRFPFVVLIPCIAHSTSALGQAVSKQLLRMVVVLL